MASERLASELATYESHKEELVSQHEGRYVLIHGTEIAGVWDTYKDALESGYQKFKLEPFLVKQIQGIEQIQFITRDIAGCHS